jgi:hypothetical protein
VKLPVLTYGYGSVIGEVPQTGWAKTVSGRYPIVATITIIMAVSFGLFII